MSTADTFKRWDFMGKHEYPIVTITAHAHVSGTFNVTYRDGVDLYQSLCYSDGRHVSDYPSTKVS